MNEKGNDALYVPPEEITGKFQNNYKADVWALGIMMYLMLYGEYPIKVLPTDDAKTIGNAKGKLIDINFPESEITDKCKAAMRSLLNPIEELRPNISSEDLTNWLESEKECDNTSDTEYRRKRLFNKINKLVDIDTAFIDNKFKDELVKQINSKVYVESLKDTFAPTTNTFNSQVTNAEKYFDYLELEKMKTDQKILDKYLYEIKEAQRKVNMEKIVEKRLEEKKADRKLEQKKLMKELEMPSNPRKQGVSVGQTPKNLKPNLNANSNPNNITNNNAILSTGQKIMNTPTNNKKLTIISKSKISPLSNINSFSQSNSPVRRTNNVANTLKVGTSPFKPIINLIPTKMVIEDKTTNNSNNTNKNTYNIANSMNSNHNSKPYQKNNLVLISEENNKDNDDGIFDFKNTDKNDSESEDGVNQMVEEIKVERKQNRLNTLEDKLGFIKSQIEDLKSTKNVESKNVFMHNRNRSTDFRRGTIQLTNNNDIVFRRGSINTNNQNIETNNLKTNDDNIETSGNSLNKENFDTNNVIISIQKTNDEISRVQKRRFGSVDYGNQKISIGKHMLSMFAHSEGGLAAVGVGGGVGSGFRSASHKKDSNKINFPIIKFA